MDLALRAHNRSNAPAVSYFWSKSGLSDLAANQSESDFSASGIRPPVYGFGVVPCIRALCQLATGLLARFSILGFGAGANHPARELRTPVLGHGKRAPAKYHSGHRTDARRIRLVGHRGRARPLRRQRICPFRSKLETCAPGQRCALLAGCG